MFFMYSIWCCCFLFQKWSGGPSELYFKIEQNRQVASSGQVVKNTKNKHVKKKSWYLWCLNQNMNMLKIIFPYISIFPPVHCLGDYECTKIIEKHLNPHCLWSAEFQTDPWYGTSWNTCRHAGFQPSKFFFRLKHWLLRSTINIW